MSAPFTIRDFKPTDEGFVSRSYKLGMMDMAAYALNPEYHRHLYHLVLQHLSPRIDCILRYSTTRIACPEGDPDLIMGFVVADKARQLVHYVFTKSTYRRFGIARALLADVAECKTATAWSRAAEKSGDRLGYAYRPSLVWPDPWRVYEREKRRAT